MARKTLGARLAQSARSTYGAVRHALTSRKVTFTELGGRLSYRRSSWITRWEYHQNANSSFGTLTMVCKSGKSYDFPDVDSLVAQYVMEGRFDKGGIRSNLKTDDPTGQHRWSHTDTTSLGGAYWYIMRRSSAIAKIEQEHARLMGRTGGTP